MPAYKTVTPTQLKSWLDNGEAVLIDVREQYENDAKRIPGAKLVSIGQVRDHQLNVPSGKKVVVHCQLGKRGSMACEMFMVKYPELEIYNLEGGITAWEREGYEVQGSER